MTEQQRRRWSMYGLAALVVIALITGALITVWVDRQQCRATAQAIANSRTMWEYLLEQNPDDPEAPAFRAEMDRRIPAAHCEGGSLVIDKSVADGDTFP